MATSTDAVFTAAANATTWTRTNLGPRTEISYDGCLWTVEIPAVGEGVAVISSRYGHGGCEILDIAATSGQTIGIVEAAQTAMRIPAGLAWRALNFTLLIGEYTSPQAARAQIESLIRAECARPHEVQIRWECTSCDGDYVTCQGCDVGNPQSVMASWGYPGFMFYGSEYVVEAVTS